MVLVGVFTGMVVVVVIKCMEVVEWWSSKQRKNIDK